MDAEGTPLQDDDGAVEGHPVEPVQDDPDTPVDPSPERVVEAPEQQDDSGQPDDASDVQEAAGELAEGTDAP